MASFGGMILLVGLLLGLILSTIATSRFHTVDSNSRIEVTSPNYPNNYDNGVIAAWVFTAEPGQRIAFRCSDVALEEGFDYLFLMDSARGQDTALRITGSTCQDYVTSGHWMAIAFASDGSITMKGFSGTVELYMAGPQPIMSPFYTVGPDSRIVVSSPNHPDHYDNGNFVGWVFTTEPGQRMAFRCSNLDLEEGWDNLFFIESVPDLTLHLRLTGSSCQDYVSSGHWMAIAFVSDRSNTRTGFMGTVELSTTSNSNEEPCSVVGHYIPGMRGACVRESECPPGGRVVPGLCPTQPSTVKCCFADIPKGACALGNGEAVSSRRGLACAIKSHHESRLPRRPRVTFVKDNGVLNPENGTGDHASSAWNNIVDTCNGQPAKRSNYSCIIRGRTLKAPGGSVDLSTRILRYILDLLDDCYSFKINALAGACHSRTSRHYAGRAVDFQLDSSQSDVWRERCASAGGSGTENFGPWSNNGHNGHTHCAFRPR